MFYFGEPEGIAQTYIESTLGITGPKLPDLHYEEMEEQQLRNCFAYLYIATQRAIQEGAEQAVVDILLEQYDAVFQFLAEVSDEFREAVRSRRHRLVVPYTPENVRKYNRLAGIDSES